MSHRVLWKSIGVLQRLPLNRAFLKNSHIIKVVISDFKVYYTTVQLQMHR